MVPCSVFLRRDLVPVKLKSQSLITPFQFISTFSAFKSP